MKITVYGLLGMIKDGQAPKKIIFDRDEYLYDQELEDYRNVKVNFRCYLIGAKYHETGWLNKEVTIILEPKSINDIRSAYGLTKIENNFTGYKMYADGKEVMSIEAGTQENKIPEKLKIEQDTQNSNYYIRNKNGTKCGLTKHSKMIVETLNQVIDYLKNKGE
ncbi:MAG: hypothetical protein ACI4VE_05760 [Clostridia bacterium]